MACQAPRHVGDTLSVDKAPAGARAAPLRLIASRSRAGRSSPRRHKMPRSTPPAPCRAGRAATRNFLPLDGRQQARARLADASRADRYAEDEPRGASRCRFLAAMPRRRPGAKLSAGDTSCVGRSARPRRRSRRAFSCRDDLRHHDCVKFTAGIVEMLLRVAPISRFAMAVVGRQSSLAARPAQLAAGELSIAEWLSPRGFQMMAGGCGRLPSPNSAEDASALISRPRRGHADTRAHARHDDAVGGRRRCAPPVELRSRRSHEEPYLDGRRRSACARRGQCRSARSRDVA